MAQNQILTFVKLFIEESKDKIAELALSELTNVERKNQLDAHITEKANELVKTLKLGWFTKMAISKWIIPNIPTYTQYIYDLLKAKIENVTK